MVLGVFWGKCWGLGGWGRGVLREMLGFGWMGEKIFVEIDGENGRWRD